MNIPLSGEPAPQSASSPVSPESAVRDFLHTLKRPCRVLVAYSGGGDSTGLLVAMADASKTEAGTGISLAAATVDHGLRPGSTEEARAAGELAAKLFVPHHILTWEGEKPKAGIQAAAREARYRLLGELARAIGADLIVTAHTLDDELETLAMRQARNVAAAGGISEAVLYDRQIWVFRPLLAVRRAAIRDYLMARGIGWAEDPSNENDKFERVRVRMTLHAGEALPDRTPQAGTAGETARFLRADAVIHSGRVAVVDLSHFSPWNIAHLDAIRHIAAMMGGRTHVSGRETTERIGGFLAGTEKHRLTAERVVFDRRKYLLYITRERRSLPAAIVKAGETAVWDNRFRITNHGSETAVIGARGAGKTGCPLIGETLPAGVPGAVRQRIEATEPMLLEGRLVGLSTKPIIAQFDRFLPLRMLEVANALAFLGGLDHFSGLPTR
jgi:tRNA(Ile)-lysidine synthase